MAITVQNLYNNTLNIYRLKLVAGREGLNKIVSWVYYTEDPETIEFIRGGELAITTGLNVERHKINTGKDEKDYIASFLEQLINEFVNRNASGLIVNVGKYIETIPQSIISLCDRLNFPLFIMPWEIHTIDVMQSVGNRIVVDSQKRLSIEQSFYDAIFHHKNFSDINLDNTPFAEASEYSIVMMEFPKKEFEDEDELKRYVDYSFNPKTGFSTNDFCCFFCDKKVVYILHSDGTRLGEKIVQLTKTDRYFTNSKVSLSGICHSIKDLSYEYEHAEVALNFCDEGDSLKTYDSLGIYKIFAEIKNVAVLQKMYDDVLGRLNDYSEQKRENYLETLKLYIESSGKIQKTADENFTHRNTINYRIHKLSEVLGLDLQSGSARYLLQTAFYIGDFLCKMNQK